MKKYRGLPCITQDNPKFISIVNELILLSKIKNPFNNNTKKYKGYKEINYRNKKGVVLPYYYALTNSDVHSQLSETEHEIDIKCNINLRDEQLEPYTKTLKVLKDEGACLLSIATGGGKTVQSIKLISELKVKTLIIVNKEFLLNQWVERIRQFSNITEVGRIQGDRINTEPSIVIGMLQSISLKNYPYEIFKSFDFVIFDEVHNLAGDSFSNALFYIGKKRYLLGLSATPERLDGLENIYLWHLNKILDYRKSITTDKYPIVKTIKLEYETIPANHTIRSGVINCQRMMSDIVNNETRNRLICQMAVNMIEKEKKRKVLLISSRREHIKTLNKILTELTVNNTITTGIYMGGMKNKELSISTEKDIIIGSISVIKEGFDVPDLNTLIIGTPLSDVTQLVGRIFRKNHTDINPLIVDILDSYSIYIPQYYKRNRIYNKVLTTNIKQKEVYTIKEKEYIQNNGSGSLELIRSEESSLLDEFSFLDVY